MRTRSLLSGCPLVAVLLLASGPVAAQLRDDPPTDRTRPPFPTRVRGG